VTDRSNGKFHVKILIGCWENRKWIAFFATCCLFWQRCHCTLDVLSVGNATVTELLECGLHWEQYWLGNSSDLYMFCWLWSGISLWKGISVETRLCYWTSV